MKHTLAVLVENKPGALTRITSMFARRGFNIESLAVGATERDDVSRITLRVDCEQHSLEQIEKQMHKLVNVLRVQELAPGESVERELALLKVAAPASKRTELMALAEVFGARVADLGPDAIVFELDRLARGGRLVPGARPPARPAGARPHRPHRPQPRDARRASRAHRSKSWSEPSNKEHTTWRQFIATAISTFSTARSRSSATAARVTRTR